MDRNEGGYYKRLQELSPEDRRRYLQLQRDGKAIQRAQNAPTGSDNLGRSPLPKRKPQEDQESSSFSPVEIKVRLVLDGNTVLESPYRAVQSLRHGSTGEMESGELWQQVLRRIRLLEGTVKGSGKPIRVTVEVEVNHDPEVEA